MKGKGFTLIELLIVIAIIGILSSVGFFSAAAARAKARDTKRVSDLKQVAKALEMYAADHDGRYPHSDDASSTDGGGTCSGPVVNGGPTVPGQAGCGWCNRWCWLSDTMKNYLDQMPKDPINNNSYRYYYNSPNAGNNQYYGIGAVLFENSSSITLYSRPNGVYPGGYETGPSVDYCLSKYSGADANWRWNSNYTICYGGN